MTEEQRKDFDEGFERLKLLVLEIMNAAREGGAEQEGQGGPDHGADQ